MNYDEQITHTPSSKNLCSILPLEKHVFAKHSQIGFPENIRVYIEQLFYLLMSIGTFSIFHSSNFAVPFPLHQWKRRLERS